VKEQIMSDAKKTRLSTFFFVSMFIFSCVGLAIGWIGWDFRTGAMVSIVMFAVFFLLFGIALVAIEDLSWFHVSLPMLGGLIYTVMPDFLPGPIDDAIVMSSTAILSFALWVRKQPETPKWIIFPLLTAGLYTLVGGLIPGPVDELLVTAIASGVSIYGTRQYRISSDINDESDSNDRRVIDASHSNLSDVE